MTLFFPDSGPNNNVKIAASNSQVGLTVGDTMTITAGDSFTIGVGSTSAIKLGPTTNFSIGSTIDLKLASSISYTYGFKAEYGAATAATSTSTKVKATDSYTIQAGVYTPVKQRFMLTEKYQVFWVLAGTILSMGAIGASVVAGLSAPIFIAPPSGSPSTASATINPSSDKNVAAICLGITSTCVFIAQWILTYFLAKSSEFSPVTNMVFNSTGINATAYTSVADESNTLLVAENKLIAAANVIDIAAGKPAKPLVPAVPSVELIMHTPPAPLDEPMIIHRVNKASVAPLYVSPQLSEVILTNNTINLNTTTREEGTVTKNTQIVMDSSTPLISLISNSVTDSNGGSITIGSATDIINPKGSTTLRSGASLTSGSSLTLTESTSATLSCTNVNSRGSVIAAPTSVNIGVTPGGSADFSVDGVTLMGPTVCILGDNINVGGALTILGSHAPLNSILTGVAQQSIRNSMAQQQLAINLTTANTKIALLEESMLAAQKAASMATEALISMEQKMSKVSS